MKPKYEKPGAFPLGEVVKGSGQCITGSGAVVGAAFDCNVGNYPYSCYNGGLAQASCEAGDNDACGSPGSAGIC